MDAVAQQAQREGTGERIGAGEVGGGGHQADQGGEEGDGDGDGVGVGHHCSARYRPYHRIVVRRILHL